MTIFYEYSGIFISTPLDNFYLPRCKLSLYGTPIIYLIISNQKFEIRFLYSGLDKTYNSFAIIVVFNLPYMFSISASNNCTFRAREHYINAYYLILTALHAIKQFTLLDHRIIGTIDMYKGSISLPNMLRVILILNSRSSARKKCKKCSKYSWYLFNLWNYAGAEILKHNKNLNCSTGYFTRK